ncbi:hypothetical protein L596_029660 [Steinernema carpocapsae]|uniref:MATH domain-containing protein n=1 Tax=Steinernema carpocapsae TaxID=34508 RepID=A0A4V5ZXK0_STECR|nr:hypothetical protein L596_029660 [Steinernema carpocapsae]
MVRPITPEEDRADVATQTPFLSDCLIQNLAHDAPKRPPFGYNCHREIDGGLRLVVWNPEMWATFPELVTEEEMIEGFPWKLKLRCTKRASNEVWLGAFVECRPDTKKEFEFCAEVEVALLSWQDGLLDKTSMGHYIVDNHSSEFGWSYFVNVKDLNDEDLGYSKNGYSVFELRVTYLQSKST